MTVAREARDAATPLMQQYRDIKSRHQDSILLFRMGDFYEMFYEDAEVASRALGLTLTSRNNGGAAEVPLAGVPVRALNDYLRKLVQQGFRVAICEQIEDPKVAKGVVRREVVETVTPGAAFNDDLLDGARNNFLCAVVSRPQAAGRRPPITGEATGIAAIDLSTGEFKLCLAREGEVDAVLARLAPREIIVAKGASESSRVASYASLLTERDAWEFDPALARDDLARQFSVHSLAGLGLSERGGHDDAAVGAAGALLRYVRELQPAGVPHLARPALEQPGGTMPLDEMTRRNLELTDSLRAAYPGERAGTLLDVVDRTLTPMGARLLRQWLLAPLTARAAIEERLDAVTALVAEGTARQTLREALDGVRDLERLGSKAAAGRANPRELRALGDSLGRVPAIERVLVSLTTTSRAGTLGSVRESWDDCAEVATEIARVLVERPPAALGEEGETIAAGIDEELDRLRAMRDGGKDAIARIQADERARTGISSLKVGYNRVFGYFIEITNSNRHLVPDDYQRRQTLAGAERYVTPALKEYESQVLNADERILERERALFDEVRRIAGAAISRLQCLASAIATLDVLASFAEVAERENYARPELHDAFALEIVAGRHPVVERMMPREKFIPNDVSLTDDARLIILTGPNMAGKSTILRQIGLIVLMAQVGCYVPATRARIGIVDRLFTRVGASDNLVRGQSTFMVEMAETSAILHTATANSLVLLDEIGRGTSTYDGVSIAWSVSEHLHDVTKCKTVFATHYHELTQLADELVAVRNFNVGVREVGDQVLFLHRLQPGGADRSYGIEVGRLAGLPDAVVKRAREVLALLEAEGLVEALTGKPGARPAPSQRTATEQMSLFGVQQHPAVDRLKSIDANALTPIQALALLDEIVTLVRTS